MENYQPGDGSERARPLLLTRRKNRDSKHVLIDAPEESRDGREVVDTEPDAIDQLEKLPVLLVHSVIVFTCALCLATAIGLIKEVIWSQLPLEVSVVPCVLAFLWFVHELVVAVKHLRVTMIQEERLRRRSIRRVMSDRRRRRRKVRLNAATTRSSSMKLSEGLLRGSSNSPGEPPPTTDFFSSSSAATTVTLETSARTGSDDDEDPVSATAAAAAAMTSSAAEEFSSTSASAAADSHSGSVSSAESDGGRVPRDKTRWLEERKRKDLADGGADGQAHTTERERKLTAAQLALVIPSPPPQSPLAPPSAETDSPEGSSSAARTPLLRKKKKRQRQRHLLPSGLSAIAARAVRISFLLQSWIRLWLSMVGFALVVGLFMLLILLRLVGIVSAQALPPAAVASPILALLAFLALHSLLLLDGNGGTGGGAAIRAGGTRSALALGRRPVVILSLLAATIMVLKLDARTVRTSGGTPFVFARWASDMSWVVALIPAWMLALLVEGVYLRALWENRTGFSVPTCIFGSGQTGGGVCGISFCCRGGRCCYSGGSSSSSSSRGLPSHYGRGVGGEAGQGGVGGVSHSSSIRRRAELTKTQEDAAILLFLGILFVTTAVAWCAALDDQDQGSRENAWEVAVMLVFAMVGEGLVGMGLWELVCEHAHHMRGGLPPAMKPLPVLFSERQGGWVVGPADPASVSVFLLGEVTLRQEGFLGGGGGGGNAGEVERLEAPCCCCC